MRSDKAADKWPVVSRTNADATAPLSPLALRSRKRADNCLVLMAGQPRRGVIYDALNSRATFDPSAQDRRSFGERSRRGRKSLGTVKGNALVPSKVIDSLS